MRRIWMLVNVSALAGAAGGAIVAIGWMPAEPKPVPAAALVSDAPEPAAARAEEGARGGAAYAGAAVVEVTRQSEGK